MHSYPQFIKMATNIGLDEHKEMVESITEIERDFFPFDEQTTDAVLLVEGKRIHVSRGVLMRASPIFRKMLTSNGKEKGNEITLPETSYQDFVLFLRCLSPEEYIKLDETKIAIVLPIAKEYSVDSILQKCEDWLLTEIEFITGKVVGHTKGTQLKVEFFMKCLLYGTKYNLESLYTKAFGLLVPYKLSRYQHTEFYKMFPDKNKWQLLEARMVKIEESDHIGDGVFPDIDKECHEVKPQFAMSGFTMQNLPVTTSISQSSLQSASHATFAHNTSKKAQFKWN